MQTSKIQSTYTARKFSFSLKTVISFDQLQQQIIIRAVLTAIYEIYSKDFDLYLNELCTLLVVQHVIIITK